MWAAASAESDAHATSEVFGRVRRDGVGREDAGGREGGSDVNFEKSGRDCVCSFERGQQTDCVMCVGQVCGARHHGAFELELG